MHIWAIRLTLRAIIQSDKFSSHYGEEELQKLKTDYEHNIYGPSDIKIRYTSQGPAGIVIPANAVESPVTGQHVLDQVNNWNGVPESSLNQYTSKRKTCSYKGIWFGLFYGYGAYDWCELNSPASAYSFVNQVLTLVTRSASAPNGYHKL